MDLSIGNLIESCKVIQHEVYHRTLDRHTKDSRMIITEQLLALSAEVGELIQECDWKSWRAKKEDIEAIKFEAVDIIIFLGNIMAFYDITDEEFNKALIAKRHYNTERDTK